MGSYTVTWPSAYDQLMLDTFSDGYQATLPDGSSNPETKIQYAKRMFFEMVRLRVKQYKAQKDATAASVAATSDIDTNLTLT